MKYRVGRATKRSVLTLEGTLVVMFEKGMEDLAQEFVNFLNNNDIKISCEHRFAFMVKDGGLMQCSDCGEIF